jgi:hypothetical protein
MARDMRRHARDGEGLPILAPLPDAMSTSAVAPSERPLATTHIDPHPCLIEIVRLLARQAARADIAAQRASVAED